MASRFQGWTRPTNSKLFHYILDGRSLCGRWIKTGFFRNAEGVDLQLRTNTLTLEQRQNGICKDCIRRLNQVKRNLQLPVLQPQPRFLPDFDPRTVIG